MTDSSAADSSMVGPGALARRVALATAGAWSIGVVALAALSIVANFQERDRDVDQALRAHAMAAYGLAWWDVEGRFDDVYLRAEPDLFSGRVRVSVATEEEILFGPSQPERAWLVQAAATTEDEVWLDHDGLRVMAYPGYSDADELMGAVIVSAPLQPARFGSARFAATTAGAALCFILLGVAMSRWIAARILTSLQASIAEREQILAGAAHELRNPMAALSALLDATPPEELPAAMPQLRGTVDRAASAVDRLLIWSRLAHEAPVLEPVRLDLLVELCMEDDEALDAQACVVRGDRRLLEVAVRNLLDNARAHGGGVAGVRVAGGRVEVADRGPGVPQDHVIAPFAAGPASRGTGLGLALVARIAARHGGRLELRPVALVLPSGGAAG